MECLLSAGSHTVPVRDAVPVRTAPVRKAGVLVRLREHLQAHAIAPGQECPGQYSGQSGVRHRPRSPDGELPHCRGGFAGDPATEGDPNSYTVMQLGWQPGLQPGETGSIPVRCTNMPAGVRHATWYRWPSALRGDHCGSGTRMNIGWRAALATAPDCKSGASGIRGSNPWPPTSLKAPQPGAILDMFPAINDGDSSYFNVHSYC